MKIKTKGAIVHRIGDIGEKHQVFEDMAKHMGDSIMGKSITEKGPVSRRKDA
jgi:hypothetical protein